MFAFIAQEVHRIGGAVWGIVIPSIVFIISFVLTWWLFVHFSAEKEKITKKRGRRGRPKENTFKKALRQYFWGEGL